MIDYFPFYFIPIPLNYNNKSKYSNHFDIIISILSIISFIIIIIYYTFESFSKEPYLYLQNDKIENMVNYSFTRLPIFIGLFDLKTHQFIANFGEIISPILLYNNKSNFTELRIRPCNQTELSELTELFTGKQSENETEYNFLNNYTTINYTNNNNKNDANYLFICPDLNGTEYILRATKNVLRTDGFTFSFIFLKKRDLPFEIDYERFQFVVVWPDYYFDSLDYYNPIKRIGKSEVLLLKNQTFEQYSLNFQLNKFISNKGFFFQDKNETSYLSYDSIQHRSYTQRLFDQKEQYLSLVSFDIFLSSKIHLEKISYIKFTDILAKIVALFSLIKQIFSKISLKVRNKTMYIDLINHFQDNEIINQKINQENEKNELNIESVNKEKKQFKLSLCQYLLPTFCFKHNSRMKLFKLYKEFFQKRISVETLIYSSLKNNDFIYSNHDKFKGGSINDSINNSELNDNKQRLIDSGWE